MNGADELELHEKLKTLQGLLSTLAGDLGLARMKLDDAMDDFFLGLGGAGGLDEKEALK